MAFMLLNFKAIRVKKYLELKEKELEEERKQQVEEEKRRRLEDNMRKAEEKKAKKQKLVQQVRHSVKREFLKVTLLGQTDGKLGNLQKGKQ